MDDGNGQAGPQVDHHSLGEGSRQVNRQQDRPTHAAHTVARRKVDVRELLPNERLDRAIGLVHLDGVATPGWIGRPGFHRGRAHDGECECGAGDATAADADDPA